MKFYSRRQGNAKYFRNYKDSPTLKKLGKINPRGYRHFRRMSMGANRREKIRNLVQRLSNAS